MKNGYDNYMENQFSRSANFTKNGGTSFLNQDVSSFLGRAADPLYQGSHFDSTFDHQVPKSYSYKKQATRSGNHRIPTEMSMHDAKYPSTFDSPKKRVKSEFNDDDQRSFLSGGIAQPIR